MRTAFLWLSLLAVAVGCDSEPTTPPGNTDPADDPACEGALLDAAGACVAPSGGELDPVCCVQDIKKIDLSFDLSDRSATATVTMAKSAHDAVVLEVGDLDIRSVLVDATEVEFEQDGARLVAPRPLTGAAKAAVLTIEYGFSVHTEFDGFLDAELSDMSFVWPEFCGNLFPCLSAPRDGIRFSIEVDGVPDGQIAVFPEQVTVDAPSYMPAFAVGDYTFEMLGTTTAGTEVGVFFFPGTAAEAMTATAHLVDAFDFLETTYGAYSFGDRVASVAVDWGEGDFGGMEHHPFWHISRGSFARTNVHYHEAAHGWFGNGVRLACREDFVLSEGVTSYLEARAAEAVGEDVWQEFQDDLETSIADKDFVVAPTTCNQIDSLLDIFTSLPYMKGAFFLRQVEHQVGRESLDAALGSFYRANVGKARRVSDLVTHLEAETGEDLSVLEQGWLRKKGLPCTLEDGDCAP